MSYSKCHPYIIRRSVLSATDLFTPLKKQSACLLSPSGFLQYISLGSQLESKPFSQFVTSYSARRVPSLAKQTQNSGAGFTVLPRGQSLAGQERGEMSSAVIP